MLLHWEFASLGRRVVGVMAAWVDGRLPWPGRTLAFNGGSSSALAAASAADETAADAGNDGEDEECSNDSTNNDADLGAFAESTAGSCGF